MKTQDQLLAELFPPFADQVRTLIEKVHIASLPFYVFMGLRTWDEQNALYAQGRTKPGEIVTNAWGGQSYHNYAVAVDLVPDGVLEKPGIQWSWNLKLDLDHDGRGDWLEMAELARACGLEPGFFWVHRPDAPHVQNAYGIPVARLQTIYKDGGLDRVWAAFNECLRKGSVQHV